MGGGSLLSDFGVEKIEKMENDPPTINPIKTATFRAPKNEGGGVLHHRNFCSGKGMVIKFCMDVLYHDMSSYAKF